MPKVDLDEAEFKRRFLSQFPDPAFLPLQGDLDRITHVAWEAYWDGRNEGCDNPASLA